MTADGIEVNTVAFEGAMQKLRSGVRQGFIDPNMGTLTVQARLLSERCADFTPPRNVGQGNAAVARDLTRIYFPQKESTYTSKTLRKVIRNDDRPAWNAAAKNFGSSHGLRNTVAIGFSEGLHQQNRDKRGRAYKAKYGNIGFVTLGPQAKAARDYIKTVKKHVGWAKGGWNMGIVSFGGTVKAGWIARHSVARGKIIDGRSSDDPYIGVINNTGWAKNNNGEGDRIIRNAVNARIRDMYSYADRMMRLAAERAMKAA